MEVDIPETVIENRKRKREVTDLDQPDYGIIGYVWDENLVYQASKLPNILGRARIVHNLINAYGLMRNVKVYKCTPATETDLCNFHSSDYIDYIHKINMKYTPEDDCELDYGIGYDCPPLDGIGDYCKAVGGSTLTAAKMLTRKYVDVAINWFGGWHHAQRDGAEGFCYINDVVLGILELRSCYDNVLYVDLDVHHGNGVETCFEITKRVLTLSFHQYEPGFYPCSGGIDDIGSGPGQYHSVNVPLKEGIDDKNYCRIFDYVFDRVVKLFDAKAIVVQCGADSLSGDPLGGFNLTEKSYGHCLRKILDLRLPTLVLGGGGYNIPNTARCWTYLTSVITGVNISPDIPDNPDFSLYGPSYELAVIPSNRKDCNNDDYVSELFSALKKNLDELYASRFP